MESSVRQEPSRWAQFSSIAFWLLPLLLLAACLPGGEGSALQRPLSPRLFRPLPPPAAPPAADRPHWHTAKASAPLAATGLLLVGRTPQGEPPPGEAFQPALSGDGRYVAYESDAPGLVPGDGNAVGDIFVWNRGTGGLERVSLGAAGKEANGWSTEPAISADGRFVAFVSEASNLVPGDENKRADVFVFDRLWKKTERVSRSGGGQEADDASLSPSLSAEGRYVAFASLAGNLARPGRPGVVQRIFLRDRLGGRTQLISANAGGAPADGWSYEPALSGQGRVVVFHSFARNLVTTAVHSGSDVYAFDRLAGQMELISQNTAGAPGNAGSAHATISADGRFVAFESFANNLVPGDRNGSADLFVRDRLTGTTRRVSLSSDGDEATSYSSRGSLSADGRLVAFASHAPNLTADDGDSVVDIFVRDLMTGQTQRVSQGPSLLRRDSIAPSLSADGTHVGFQTLALAGEGAGLWRVVVMALPELDPRPAPLVGESRGPRLSARLDSEP